MVCYGSETQPSILMFETIIHDRYGFSSFRPSVYMCDRPRQRRKGVDKYEVTAHLAHMHSGWRSRISVVSCFLRARRFYGSI